LVDNSGKQLTIKDVVDAILALGIPVYFMGGFLRDIIQNKRADDIDLRFGRCLHLIRMHSNTHETACVCSFATDPAGMARIVQHAEEQGWAHSVGKVRKQKDDRCPHLLQQDSVGGWHKPREWLEQAQQENPKGGLCLRYIQFGEPID
jgi:hypothetical protein